MLSLEIRNLEKRFGGLPAVDGVDVDVHPGEILAVIGPNGAGKSTLLQMVSGLLEPSRGTIRLDARDIAGLKPHQVRHLGIAKALQVPRLFRSMTVRENAALGALFGAGGGRRAQGAARAAADEVLGHLGLAEKADHAVDRLTLHEKRQLELARALAGRPGVLLLDEVMAGLNPSELDRYVQVIRELRDRLGTTIVWVEHVMRAVTALADRVVVLDLGRVLTEGTPGEVMEDPAVVAAYLGVTTDDDADR